MKDKTKVSASVQRAHADLNAKKEAFLAAAREVDFLEPLRKHPFSTVGAAALAGAVVGSHRGGTPVAAGKAATKSVSKLLPLISSLVQGYMAVRQQAHQASAEHDAGAGAQSNGSNSTASNDAAPSAAEAVSYS